MPHSPGSRALPARPDLSSRLLAAIGERDPQLARRLGQQWVHRRGLTSLEAFLVGPLTHSQGPGAVEWLLGLLELEGRIAPTVAEITAEITVAELISPQPDSDQPISAQPLPDQVRSDQSLRAQPAATPVPAAPGPKPLLRPRGQRLSIALTAPAEGEQPAPPPASLAALRAWLPDERDLDLPEAC